jgi:hypothetical protein
LLINPLKCETGQSAGILNKSVITIGNPSTASVSSPVKNSEGMSQDQSAGGKQLGLGSLLRNQMQKAELNVPPKTSSTGLVSGLTFGEKSSLKDHG